MNRTYSPYALSRAVNKVKMPKAMVVTEKIFRQRERRDARNVDWDIISGSDALMPALSIYAPAYVGQRTKTDTVTAQMPRLSEIRSLSVLGQRLARREPGAADRPTETMKGAIRREHQDLVRKIGRTTEYMAAKSLGGTIELPDEDGAMVKVADWEVPAKNKPAAYTNAARWTEDDSDPAQNVIAMKTQISLAVGGGVEEWIAFAGTKAASALRTNKSLKGDGKRLKLKRVAEELEIDEIIHYDDAYISDGSADWTPFVATNEFLLVGWSNEFFSLMYLDVYDLLAQRAHADGVMGTDIPAAEIMEMLFYSDMWMVRDPLSYQLMVSYFDGTLGSNSDRKFRCSFARMLNGNFNGSFNWNFGRSEENESIYAWAVQDKIL